MTTDERRQLDAWFKRRRIQLAIMRVKRKVPEAKWEIARLNKLLEQSKKED